MAAKHVAQVVLLLTGMIADGFFYSAHAQCADTDKSTSTRGLSLTRSEYDLAK
jgi:hypothetical protein